jgi:kinesin family member C2/C3
MQKRSKLHLSGILTENNSSDSVENCNGLRKKMESEVWANKTAVCESHFENSNSFLDVESDTTQLRTSFYQRYNPVRQSCGTESVRPEGPHNFGPAATSCSDQMVVSTIGLKAAGVTNRGASTIKKPEVTPAR